MVHSQSIAVACLVLFPLPAIAADAASSSLSGSLLLLGTVVVLFGGGVWLGLRLMRLVREKSELAARSQLAEQALEQAPLPVLRLDAELRVIAANRCAQHTHAHVKPSLIGVSLLDLHPQLKEHPGVVAVQTAQRQGIPVPLLPSLEPDKRQPGAPGELVTTAVAGQTRILWFGAPPVSRDLIQEFSDVASRAEESASRMKSEFIANINHEVRTPMNAIIGYTEMLANSQLGPKEKRFVAIIHKSSMALVSIFNDIMELSKIDSGRLQIMASTVRLESIVNDVEGLFKDLAEEKGILLTTRIADHVPRTLVLDGVRLKQILQNLVSNAVKFTREGSVSLLVDGFPSTVQPGCLALSFTIEDTGIGIQEADQQKIFELFRQREDVITKQYGGVGLGLTLCSRLTAMMGGRIDLYSREGEGTRFTLFLDDVPVAEPAPVTPEPAAEVLAKGGERKLLVVDDVDLIKDVFLDYFQGTPYKVLTAGNGDEALALARSEHPDIIFMDLNLTGADGRSVTGKLRGTPETATIPVVVMTGEMLEETDYRPLFDDFLQKPFRLESLQGIVSRLVTRTGSAESAPPATVDSGDGDEQLLALRATGIWSADLESLRQQAVFSGSLTDAASLGAAMRQQGVATRQPILTRMGEELLAHAQEPNILGVDRILAKLSRITNRNEP